MNYILKNAKNHQKTSSNLLKTKKKQISSTEIIFNSNLINNDGNEVSSFTKKNNFTKRKKLLRIKNLVKTNIIESNQRNSKVKLLLNAQNTSIESKGESDVYENISKNNLSANTLNNELNISNTLFKNSLLSSSKKMINYIVNTNNNLYFNIKNYNTDDNINNKNFLFNRNNDYDYSSFSQSQSNKEIKNNKSVITQRCRHKQVKREIYSTNKTEINDKDDNNSLSTYKIIKNNLINMDISLEFKKSKNKLLVETPINIKEKNKNISLPMNKNNKEKERENFMNSSKKQLSLLELYNFKNKSNKRFKNNFINENKNINIKHNNNFHKEEENNNEKKKIEYFKRMTIHGRIKKIKSPFFNDNFAKNENNINKDNLIFLNNTVFNKYKCHKIKSNDNINYSKYKSVNKINNELNGSKNNNLNDSINCNNGKLILRAKNKNNKQNYKNNEKKLKENDISFDEDELDEKILSLSGKLNDNKKCQTMINKVFHFETGSNEIFNNFKIQNNMNDICDINYFNKNQSTKNVNDKKNSSNNIIDNNYAGSHSSNNNVIINNINIIIKNNINYNLNKKKKLKNYHLLKKCNTNVILDNTKNNEINEDNSSKNKINKYNLFLNQKEYNDNNIINKEYISSETSTTSIKINKNIYNNRNIKLSKNLRYISYSNKNLIYQVFKCEKFKENLLFFSDMNSLNKVCLLSKKIHKLMRPLIYEQISSIIYNPNKMHKNLKIKKYLMEKFSPLSKLSPALIRKKYIDLKFENNHKYDSEIKKDLTRTFPDNILFKYGNNYYNKLYHVLSAFSNYNKNIGYIQGLNFLAAHIIYFFDEEIDEFIFLDALIHKFDLEKILCVTNNNFFIKKLEESNNYIKNKLPKLSAYLNDMKLNYEFFTTNWILTLFSNSMETNNLFYVWDFMIIFGWKFFRCFVVAVLDFFEKDILNGSQNNLTYIMKNMLKNKKFNDHFKEIIFKTKEMLINENDII